MTKYNFVDVTFKDGKLMHFNTVEDTCIDNPFYKICQLRADEEHIRIVSLRLDEIVMIEEYLN